MTAKDGIARQVGARPCLRGNASHGGSDELSAAVAPYGAASDS